MSFFKTLKKNIIIESVGFMIVGLVLVIWPDTSMNTICNILGGLLMIGGVASLVAYCTKDDVSRYFSNDLVQGLVLLVLGAFVIFCKSLIISLIPMLIGLLVVVSGCNKVQDSLNLYFSGLTNWIWILLLALVSIAAGIFLIVRPAQAAEAMVVVMGAFMIYSGVTDFLTACIVAHKVRKVFPESRIINGTCEEVDDREEEE